MTTFVGTSGDDNLVGTATADTFNLTQGGNDTASGQAGGDLFRFNGTFDTADHVSGGLGNDSIQLNGDYSLGVLLTGASVSSVESIILLTGFTYALTTDNAFLQIGQSLTIDGSALGGSNRLLFDGSAETTSDITVTSGAGNDIIFGGGGNDFLTGGAGNNHLVAGSGDDSFDLHLGGHDSADGGDGNDVFIMGAALDFADSIEGGDGNDMVILDGTYSGLEITGQMLGSVERLVLNGSTNYNLTIDDDVVSGHLVVDASVINTDHQAIIDASDITGGTLKFIGGAGADHLTGSQNRDVFDLSHGGGDVVAGENGDDLFLMGAAWTTAMSVDGGGGSDTVRLTADYFNGINPVHIDAAMLFGVERLELAKQHFYSLDTTDDIVSTGTLTIDASGAFQVFFHDNAVSDGDYHFIGSQGQDQVVLGDGDDVVTGNGDNDTIGTGAGNNVAYGNAGDDTLIGDIGIDHLIGGVGNDTIYGEDDDDFITGGAGNDTITGGLGHDTLRGGAGNDTLIVGTGFGDDLGGDMWSADGADIFKFGSGDSIGGATGWNIGFIHDFDSASDHILVQTNHAITAIDGAGAGGSVSHATFQANISSIIGAGQLGANHAVFLSVSGGDMGGEFFLVIDANGVAGWQLGDYVIEVPFVPSGFAVSDIQTYT